MNIAQRCSLDIRKATLYYVIITTPSSQGHGPVSSTMWLNSDNILFKKKYSKRLSKLSDLKFHEIQEQVNLNIKKANKKHDDTKCEGIYCNYKECLENALIDDKDELNNLYLMNEDEKDVIRKVEYKSIVLDIVEKHNTMKRLVRYTDIPLSQLKKLK